jgi:hypothetical protein
MPRAALSFSGAGTARSPERANELSATPTSVRSLRVNRTSETSDNTPPKRDPTRRARRTPTAPIQAPSAARNFTSPAPQEPAREWPGKQGEPRDGPQDGRDDGARTARDKRVEDTRSSNAYYEPVRYFPKSQITNRDCHETGKDEEQHKSVRRGYTHDNWAAPLSILRAKHKSFSLCRSQNATGLTLLKGSCVASLESTHDPINAARFRFRVDDG